MKRFSGLTKKDSDPEIVFCLLHGCGNSKLASLISALTLWCCKISLRVSYHSVVSTHFWIWKLLLKGQLVLDIIPCNFFFIFLAEILIVLCFCTFLVFTGNRTTWCCLNQKLLRATIKVYCFSLSCLSVFSCQEIMLGRQTAWQQQQQKSWIKCEKHDVFHSSAGRNTCQWMCGTPLLTEWVSAN